MLNFSNEYNSLIEKTLRKVFLKVDPKNKYAEDFRQYDGYQGYILAEDENNYKFFADNNIITIPKKAVMIEGFWSGLAGTDPRDGARTAIGTIGRNVAGTAARAMFGSGVTGNTPAYTRPNDPAPGPHQNATPNVQGVGLTKIPQDMHGKSFVVKNSRGVAYIAGRGRMLYITQIKLVDTGKILESNSFSSMFDEMLPLIKEQQAGTPPPLPNQPNQTQPQTQPQQQPQVKVGVLYANLITKPEFLNQGSFITLQDRRTKGMFQGYGQLTRIPNTNDFSFGFASYQP